VILMLYRCSETNCLEMMLLFWSSSLHNYPKLGDKTRGRCQTGSGVVSGKAWEQQAQSQNKIRATFYITESRTQICDQQDQAFTCLAEVSRVCGCSALFSTVRVSVQETYFSLLAEWLLE